MKLSPNRSAREDGARPAWLPATKGAAVDLPGARQGQGPVALKGSMPPLMKLIVAMALALFWNGILAVFIMEMITGWLRGRGDLCLTFFLIPFEVIGLVMIGAVVYCALACLNPRLDVVVNRVQVTLGASITVAYRVTGRYDRINNLRLWLEGREKAKYRQGTSTRTDTSVFARIPLVDATTDADIPQGKATAVVPDHTMHSFQSQNNKILWVIGARGQITRWPDIIQEYPIVVLPHKAHQEVAS